MTKKEFKNSNKKLDIALLISGSIVLLLTFIFIILNATTYYDEKYNIIANTPRLQAVFKHFSSLFFFTYLSNIFLGIMLILVGLERESMKIKRMFFLSVVFITITFIVYWALISHDKKTWKAPYYNAIKSIITHAIHPIVGFVFLIIMRKEITIDKKTISVSVLTSLFYLLFAIFLYWGSYNKIVKGRGAIIYTFLDFVYPLFYKSNNLYVIISLNILILLIATLLPIALIFFWKSILKIKFENSNPKKIKQIKI
ncbi:hypothetical protein JS510_01045 [Mycoplasma tauri]|uniref:MAGa3780 family membrane protein n=1 Tax=Mycoplasma tauri TaxID=547987 RepID=UPI001966F5D1|nr:hypothetical protein [Mycoplasma tauri]QSB07693.1 hypothetical protein JS510_01045 [Mycoplasma tauri]